MRRCRVLLPTKGVVADRALLAVGAEILELLREPNSVSSTWDRLRAARAATGSESAITFDWFALALACLYAVGVIVLTSDGRIERTHVPA